jgi:2-succinyl-6-hydroxy-2,4-cyclohexadiene-1-carboxylate synthase
MCWHFSRSGSSFPIRLIWFHGFMGASTDWQALYAPSFQDYENVYLDLPGHGKSHLDDHLEAPDLFAALNDQLAELGSKPTILIGYSMGGRAALHYARHYPEQIRGFVGLSVTAGLAHSDERALRLASDMVLMYKLKQIGFQRFLAEWYQLPLFRTLRERPELLKQLMRNRAENDPMALRFSLTALGNGALPDIWPQLGTIDFPVLLGCGEKDEKYLGIRTDMMKRIPDAALFTVTECSHAFHLEKPLETIQAIRHFVSNRIKGG